MISVIIPTFNREKLIERAIKSVIAQTYTDIEVIVVDDNSSDNTEHVVRSINDGRIIYYKLENNQGACVARNVGIKLAKGDFIAFLDSDDEWHHDKLEKQIHFMKTENSDIVFCKALYIKGEIQREFPNEFFDSNKMYYELLLRNLISTVTILAKTSCFNNIKFDENLPKFQDWDIVLRLSQQYRINFLNEPLVTVYFQEQSITSDIKHEKEVAALRNIMKKHDHASEYDNNVAGRFHWRIAVCLLEMKSASIREFKKALTMQFSTKRLIAFSLALLKLNGLLRWILNVKRSIV
jgi:Glycosyltransferases involved in cell wall biogenesis